MKTETVLARHPQGRPDQTRVALINALAECQQACLTCADACLAEDDPKMLAQCIRSDLDCAALCGSALAVASRLVGEHGDVFKAAVEACRTACKACAEECEKHDHDHCTACAEACRACEKACEAAL